MINLLSVNNLKFQYKHKVLFDGFSLSLKKGEIATLIGASGSGKSTLFKILAGQIPLTSGTISIDNERVDNCMGTVAYMTQEELFLPWRTVLNNVTLSTELGKNPRKSPSVEEEARELLRLVDMAGCENMYPHELSGGMRQRVALARALLDKKTLLLLDEPFAALDVCLREQIYLLLRDIRKKYQTTILLVTHDFRDAISLSDRVFLLANKHVCREWVITDTVRADPYLSAIIQKEMREGLNPQMT